MSVVVLEPPVFVSVPLSQLYHAAKTVRFDCEVTDKTAEVKWLKDGKLLQINGKLYIF